MARGPRWHRTDPSCRTRDAVVGDAVVGDAVVGDVVVGGAVVGDYVSLENKISIGCYCRFYCFANHRWQKIVPK